MKNLSAATLLFLAGALFAASIPKLDPVPIPVSNNAVTAIKVHGQSLIFSFMGIGAKKNWSAITNMAYSLDAEHGKWSQIHPVPGTAGRIGAVAVSAREQVFLLGGHVVDGRGDEITLPDVNVYVPLVDRWYRGSDLPRAVDGPVAGVYRDRYLYIISGRSNTETIKDVQVYDVEKNQWLQATPVPGAPVFGHAGALVGDTIVYVDGAHKDASGMPKYVSTDECWMGKINRGDPTKIEWTKLPPHPGTARFRIAAGGSEKDQKIYFSGGTDNPYDYDGIGFDGKPSEPSPVTFAFNLRSGKWEVIVDNAQAPTMDHRGMIVASYGLIVVGGMEKGQQVTARVAVLPKQAKTP